MNDLSGKRDLSRHGGRIDGIWTNWNRWKTVSCPPLRPVITARLYREGKCFGPGVAMLLRRVRTLRSLRAAAMDMDMAYSKAWTILRNAERQLGVKLLQSRAEAATEAAPH